MDNIDGNFCSWWRRDFVNLLFCIVAKVLFFWKFVEDVEIPGFVNIGNRRVVRAERRNARRDLEEEWDDTPESRQDYEANGWSRRYLDIFNLRGLFEMQDLFDEICELSYAGYEERRRREEEEERRRVAELVERARLRDREIMRRLRPHVRAQGG